MSLVGRSGNRCRRHGRRPDRRLPGHRWKCTRPSGQSPVAVRSVGDPWERDPRDEAPRSAPIVALGVQLVRAGPVLEGSVPVTGSGPVEGSEDMAGMCRPHLAGTLSETLPPPGGDSAARVRQWGPWTGNRCDDRGIRTGSPGIFVCPPGRGDAARGCPVDPVAPRRVCLPALRNSVLAPARDPTWAATECDQVGTLRNGHRSRKSSRSAGASHCCRRRR